MKFVQSHTCSKRIWMICPFVIFNTVFQNLLCVTCWTQTVVTGCEFINSKRFWKVWLQFISRWHCWKITFFNCSKHLLSECPQVLSVRNSFWSYRGESGVCFDALSTAQTLPGLFSVCCCSRKETPSWEQEWHCSESTAPFLSTHTQSELVLRANNTTTETVSAKSALGTKQSGFAHFSCSSPSHCTVFIRAKQRPKHGWGKEPIGQIVAVWSHIIKM